MYAAAVREAGSLRVTSLTTKEDRKPRPAGLNTVELLKVASSALNIGPAQAMQVGGEGAGREFLQTSLCSSARAHARLLTPPLRAAARARACMHNTLDCKVAERLYTSGVISYPRTESSAYPQNFDIAGVCMHCDGCIAPTHHTHCCETAARAVALAVRALMRWLCRLACNS